MTKHDWPKRAPGQLASYRLALVRMIPGDVSDLVPEREGELGLIVHEGHQLAGDVNIAPGNRKSVLDRGVEGREVKRLSGLAMPENSCDPPAEDST